MNAQTKDALKPDFISIEDSVNYIRLNAPEVYGTKSDMPRKTISNVPEELLDELKVFAEQYNMKLFEALAALLDFHFLYEEVYEAALAEKRKNLNKRKRRK